MRFDFEDRHEAAGVMVADRDCIGPFRDGWGVMLQCLILISALSVLNW